MSVVYTLQFGESSGVVGSRFNPFKNQSLSMSANPARHVVKVDIKVEHAVHLAVTLRYWCNVCILFCLSTTITFVFFKLAYFSGGISNRV